MQTQTLLETLLIRHGESKYTGKGLDLTPEGVKQAKTTAKEHVATWLTRRGITEQELVISSSPAPRARGTALLIRKHVPIKKRLQVVPALGPMAWRNPEECIKALKGLSGRGYIDYETEPIFADPKLFETPSEMSVRWYTFFADLIRKAQLGKVLRHRMLFSHYEVFCHVVFDLFGIVASEATALKNAEPISLSVEAGGDPRYVVVTGWFRGKMARNVFDLANCRFL